MRRVRREGRGGARETYWKTDQRARESTRRARREPSYAAVVRRPALATAAPGINAPRWHARNELLTIRRRRKKEQASGIVVIAVETKMNASISGRYSTKKSPFTKLTQSRVQDSVMKTREKAANTADAKQARSERKKADALNKKAGAKKLGRAGEGSFREGSFRDPENEEWM
eukprot:COSAG02_NODE_17484_length_1000_cov_1.051054_2_plen_172_part_00